MTSTATLPAKTAATLAAELGRATLSLREQEALEAIEAAKRGARIQRRLAEAERAEVAAALTPKGRAAAERMTPTEIGRLAAAATGAAQRAAARRGAPRLSDEDFSDVAADVAAYIWTADAERPDTPGRATLAAAMLAAPYGTARADLRAAELDRRAAAMLAPLRARWQEGSEGRAVKRAAGILAERNTAGANTAPVDTAADLGDADAWNSTADPDTLADALAAAGRPLSTVETIALDRTLGVHADDVMAGPNHAAALGIKTAAYRKRLERGRAALAKRWPDPAALAADLAAARLADLTADERAALAESNTAAAMTNAERHSAGHAGGTLGHVVTDDTGRKTWTPTRVPVSSFYLTAATPGDPLATTLAAAGTVAVARAIHRDPDPCPYRRANLHRAARLERLYRRHRARTRVWYTGDALAALSAALRPLLAPPALAVSPLSGKVSAPTINETAAKRNAHLAGHAPDTGLTLAPPTHGNARSVLLWLNRAEQAIQRGA